MMNVSTNRNDKPGNDPLGLRDVPEPRPDTGRIDDDWAVVSAALQARNRRRRQAWMGGLAAAASLILVVALLTLPRPEPAAVERVSQTAGGPAEKPSIEKLIAMSQDMERQLRFLRRQVSSMPSELVVYQVELQDLIGQVDDALSLSPGSKALWSQRLGLQLDLVKLYRSQLRRDDLRLASI